jgi:flagellar biosynthesis component FlhA
VIIRVILLVALAASAAVVLYGLLLDRTGQAIAFTVAGLLVLGVTTAVISVGLARAGLRAGNEGRAVRAFGGTFVGGLFALAASASLLLAIVLGVSRMSV